jgi:glucosamine kinase
MPEDQYFIGIDGGGTSCRARIANAQGSILGEAKSGTGNIFQNADLAWESVCNSIANAFNVANLPMPSFNACHVVAGLAGAGSAVSGLTPRGESFVARAKGFKSFELFNDAQIACLGAHGGSDGAVFIIGTGSVGISLYQKQWRRMGGWGFPLHDLGSGAWLGQQAIRAALDQRDGLGASSELTNKIWASFEADSGNLISWSQTATSGDYGKLAPLVIDAFTKKDVNAEKIIVQQVHLLTKQIGLLAESNDALCLMGGLSSWVYSQMPPELKNRITEPKGDALEGALTYALRLS